MCADAGQENIEEQLEKSGGQKKPTCLWKPQDSLVCLWMNSWTIGVSGIISQNGRSILDIVLLLQTVTRDQGEGHFAVTYIQLFRNSHNAVYTDRMAE